MFELADVDGKPPNVSAYKRAKLKVLSASAASCLETILLHPLDVLKTRSQLRVARSKGVIYYFGKMYRKEGILSYWKGILPPVMNVLRFTVYEHTKQLYQFGAPKPNVLSYSLAGCTAGSLEAFVITPFELIKVKQQADKQRFVFSYIVGREIVRTSGLLGLYKGFTATMMRNGCYQFLFFGLYFGMKDAVPKHSDHTVEFLRKAIVAFSAGTVGMIVDNPFDVAKSRIQGPQPVKGENKYRHTFQSIGTIYREEGFRALFKGMVPKILRTGTGGAVMMLGYEYIFEHLLSRYCSEC